MIPIRRTTWAARIVRLLAVTALTTFIAVGCRPRNAVPVSLGILRPPADFSVDFLLQQRLTFTRGDVERTLQTALQRRGDELVLIGLTPLGTRAFVVQQQGLEVSAQSHLPGDEPLPFPPRAVLIDVQRALLPVLDGPPPSDGRRSGERAGEAVSERWANGRLVERRFRRLSNDPEGV